MKKEYLILAAILLFGLSLRVYGLGHPPFWIDEAISAVASENLHHGTLGFDSGAPYHRAVVYHFAESFFLLFGHSEYWARFASVIFGMMAVYLAYLIGKEYSVGLLSAFLVSVFYLQVFFSRQARFYQLFQLCFFLSLYLMYRSLHRRWLIYPSLAVFLVAVDSQIAGIVIAPFMVAFILYFRKDKWLAAVPALVLAWKIFPVFGLGGGSVSGAVSTYLGSFPWYWLLLAVPGLYLGYRKNRIFTLIIAVPTIVLLAGVLMLKLIALRYVFFVSMPLMVYSAVTLAGHRYRYGYAVAAVMVLAVSNIILPMTYTTILRPVDYNLYDPSAPVVDLKGIAIDGPIMTFFSPSVEWYIRKPDYVFPFTLSGIGNDSISYHGVDVYSGAPVTLRRPEGGFTFIAPDFAVDKLTERQMGYFRDIVSGCDVNITQDLSIYYCNLK